MYLLHGYSGNYVDWIIKVPAIKQYADQDSIIIVCPDGHYNSWYFDAPMDFNIAHSGNIVMCCGTLLEQVGIDIEEVKPINLEDYTDYFTPNEWDQIHGSANSQEAFYYFWTRKEAIIKAIGTGFHTPLSSVDVSGDNLAYEGITYYLYQLNIKAGYKCHIACTAEIDDLRLMRVNL